MVDFKIPRTPCSISVVKVTLQVYLLHKLLIPVEYSKAADHPTGLHNSTAIIGRLLQHTYHFGGLILRYEVVCYYFLDAMGRDLDKEVGLFVKRNTFFGTTSACIDSIHLVNI